MNKCRDCGREFDDSSAGWKTAPSFLGEPKQSDQVCPSCGSDDYEEATQCAWCGEWCLDDEIYGSSPVCKECADELITLENALLVGAEDEQSGLNGFVRSYLTRSEIERAAIEIIKTDAEISPARIRRGIKDYADGDKESFMETILKKLEEKNNAKKQVN